MWLPPGTPAYPLDWVWAVVPMRGYPLRGSPPSQPRRAQGWKHRVDRCGGQQPSRGRQSARRRARQREHQEQRRVRLSGLSGRFDGGRFVADAPCPPRPAGSQRCTVRRSTATSAPPCCYSSAAPARPSRTTTGTLCRPQHVPPTASDGRTPSARSVQANASPSRTSQR